MNFKDKTPMPGEDVGSLPEQGMLGTAYVPYQMPGRKYDQAEGLRAGTLFPGLNLPFHDKVITRDVANTPLGEIMALDFALNELRLYLDTHPKDKEALDLFNTYAKMYDEFKKAYEAAHGPLGQYTVMPDGYTWLGNPWPWEGSKEG